MKTNITKIVLAALLCAMTVACGGDAKLKTMVNEMNKMCPVSLGATGTMDKVDYTGNTVTLYYTVDANLINFDAFRENEELIHNSTLVSYANNQEHGFKMLIDAIVEAGVDMDVVMNNSEGDSYTFHFTAEELKANRPGDDSDPLVFLQNTVETTRLQLPMEIGGGITFSDAQLDDKNFTFVYECDEELIDLDILQQQFVDNREETISSIDMSDPMTAKLIKAIKAANRGYSMRYIGKTSGKVAEIVIGPEEL